MEIAILGLPQSGKSTLFQIMTGVNSREIFGEQFVKGVADIPDNRFDRLVEIFKPVKVTPAKVPFIDVNVSGEKGWDSIRQSVGGVDSVLHIINCFSTDDISEMAKRYRTLEDELIFLDLVIVERRLERLSKLPRNVLKAEESLHMEIMPRYKKHLEDGLALRDLDMAVKNFAFWSLKPELVVLNTSEGGRNLSDDFRKASGTKSPVLNICCQIEAEIAALPPEDRKDFLESLGIETPAFQKIVQTAFAQLERIYYFTVGEDEVRAWVIKRGSTAPQAAAVIHKDFERGFIKAEVVSYKDFIDSGGTLSKAKASGKLRLEGKDYIVQDGDIISFRFNV